MLSREFTTIKRQNNNTNYLISSLYSFISNQLELSDSNLTNMMQKKLLCSFVDSNSDRKAYIFKLSPPPNSLHPEYTGQVDSHLTVDRVYAKDGSRKSIAGFSIAHYTERYKTNHDSEDHVWHVYFGVNGTIINAQHKINGIQQPIDEQQRLLIQQNSIPAKELLLKILSEKNQQYLDVLSQANDLEEELTEVAKNRFKFKDYQRIAAKFIEQIELLNAYNELEIDPRGEIIKKSTDKYQEILQKKSLSVSVGGKENSSTVIINKQPQNIDTTLTKIIPVDSSDKITEEIKLAQQKISDNLRLINKITKCKSSYSNYTEEQIQECIRLDSLAQEISSAKLELLFLMSSQDYAKIEATINTESTTLPNLNELFIDQCGAGNIDNVELLFPKVKQSLNANHYIKILHAIGCRGNIIKEQEQGQLEVCKYLFENSCIYRSILQLKSANILFQSDSSDQLMYSFAYTVFLANKLQLFTLLLQQGINANQIAIISKDIVLTLPYAICFSVSAQKISAQQFLLVMQKIATQGGILDEYHTEKHDKGMLLYSMQKLTVGNTEIPKITTTNTIHDDFHKLLQKTKSTHSALEIMCGYICESEIPSHLNAEVLGFFAQYSSLEAILLSIAILSNKKSILSGYRNESSGMICAASESIVHEQLGATSLWQQIAEKKVALNCSKIAMIFYPDPGKDVTMQPYMGIIAALIYVLQQKMEGGILNQEKFDLIYKKLISLGYESRVMNNSEINKEARTSSCFLASVLLIIQCLSRITNRTDPKHIEHLMKKLMQSICLQAKEHAGKNPTSAKVYAKIVQIIADELGIQGEISYVNAKKIIDEHKYASMQIQMSPAQAVLFSNSVSTGSGSVLEALRLVSSSTAQATAQPKR